MRVMPIRSLAIPALALASAALVTVSAQQARQPAAQISSRTVPAAVRQRIRIDDARLQRHVITPAHLIGIQSDEHAADSAERSAPAAGHGLPAARRRAGGTQPAGPALPALDVARFGQALHVRLRSSVAGYAMRLYQNGAPIYTLQWEWARRPGDGSVAWTPERRQHIASVSKLITAIGMARALEEKNLSYDTKIIGYLPAHWKKGPNLEDVTFRQLLRHRSGFSTGGSGSDFALMKQKVAAGVTATGMYDYENMNFGLCRILIPFVLYGDFLNAFSLSDEVWDYVTITAYTEFMQNRVFGPSGVTGATLTPEAATALAYPFPAASPGWNSGDLSTVSGGAGWHMSVDEVLRVLATFRHKGTILPGDKAQALLDAGLGIDQVHETPAGPIYNKNGRWQNGARQVQSVAFVLPGRMELVVLVNSRIAGPGGAADLSLRDLVRETYVANLK